MKIRALVLAVTLMVATGLAALAQAPKPASPAGTAAAQVLGKYVKGARGESYQEGKWIEVTYGRPILRARQNIFGAGADYGKAVNGGAPVWRAGANQTTRLKTEVPLIFDGKQLPAGEYSLFVELNEKAWTLILSGWPAQEKYDPNNKAALWGAYGYTPDKDVLRVTMTLSSLQFSVDQFTIAFIDMTAVGGRLAMMWDKTMASVPFAAAR
jgi:hypothetical protein